MTGTANKTDDPCEECRNRHLKCRSQPSCLSCLLSSCYSQRQEGDNNRPRCDNCSRTGQKCCRTKGLRKFRDGSSAQYEKQFSKDQVWLGFSKNAKIQIVDQTPELENFYSIEEPDLRSARTISRPDSSASDSANIRPSVTSNPHSRSPSRQSTTNSDFIVRSPIETSLPPLQSQLNYSPNKRRRTSDPSPFAESRNGPENLPPITEQLQRSYVLRDRNSNSASNATFSEVASPTESASFTRKIEAEFHRLADTEAARIPDEPFLSPVVWKEQFFWPNQYTTAQCECLFSYYIEQLGPSFDAGDPHHHFTSIVPARARRCPPLLNAIFAAASLHLRYMHEKKTGRKEVRYRHISLPNLKELATLKYYHASISYLRVLSANELYVRDEDLLAATVILRYYEELETEINAEPPDKSSRPFQLMVAAQARPFFTTQIPYDDLNFNLVGVFDSVRQQAEEYLKGYRHASFRIALRQECSSALLRRGSPGFSLEAWSILESFDEVEDSIWTDRHLYHYAKVLQFCFSPQDLGRSGIRQWQELKNWETRWEYSKPITFAAYRKKEPAKERGEVFPELWYVSELHAAAHQFYQLSRILLTVYDPNLQRIGPGSLSAQRKVSEQVRESVKLVCGIAMATLHTQSALVHAHNAIAMFGEHFTDRNEQEALLKVLKELEINQGWPTSHTVKELMIAWSW